VTELTRFEAVVIRAGWVRSSQGDSRCDGAEGLPVGSRVQVVIRSDSQGSHTVVVGGATAPLFDNTALRGNPWVGNQGRWSM
jgi:hypothetical protein